MGRGSARNWARAWEGRLLIGRLSAVALTLPAGLVLPEGSEHTCPVHKDRSRARYSAWHALGTGVGDGWRDRCTPAWRDGCMLA